MPKTRINCPNCHQPIVADINQVFDMNVDPSAKQQLLSGAYNLAQCQFCGYQGNIASPLVYHDPEKELLISFVPPEIGLPRNDQERLLGGLINQVVSKLPPEKRKAYILQPRSALTMQGVIEQILEKDGITHEMIQAQQQRLELIQRLAETEDPAVRRQIAEKEDALIDVNFFNLLRRLQDVAAMGGDQNTSDQLSELQELLLSVTSFGRDVKSQSDEVEAAVNDLKTAGKSLTRDSLLDMMVNAPNETRLRALVNFTRSAMDYPFFQILSDRISAAEPPESKKLEDLRQTLLGYTAEIDRQIEAHVQDTRKVLNKVLEADNIQEALVRFVPGIDEYFLQEVNAALQEARQKGDLARSAKVQQIIDLIQQANKTSPGMELIEQLLDIESEAEQRQLLEENRDLITPEFLSDLGNIAAQMQQGEDDTLRDRVIALNRLALRFSMEANLR